MDSLAAAGFLGDFQGDGLTGHSGPTACQCTAGCAILDPTTRSKSNYNLLMESRRALPVASQSDRLGAVGGPGRRDRG